MGKKVNVACVQMDVVNHELQATTNNVCSWIGKAGKSLADIVVFPELILSAGYYCLTSNRMAQKLSDTVPGKITDQIGDKAKENNLYVVAGIAERDSSGGIYDSAVLINRSGEVAGVYRKVHVYEPTEGVFTPGSDFSVFKTDFGTIAMPVCFDLEFPESARIFAINGAEIFFHLVADWMNSPSGLAYKFFDIIWRARAIENFRPIAVSNRVGFDPDLYDHFIGSSEILNGYGDVLARAGDKEEMIMATVELGRPERTRQVYPPVTETFDYLRYRKPSAYKLLSETNLADGRKD